MMTSDRPRSWLSIAGRPLHALLVPFPIVCFIGTLITDVLYWRTANNQWVLFSDWMLSAGLVIAFFAVLAGLADFLASRRIRAIRSAWIHGAGNGVAMVLAIINGFVHTRDGYTSVVPTGLFLSFLVVVILAFTGWIGTGLVHRYGVGAPE